MMGKTHVAMGVAVATLILRPTDVPSCLVAVSGGALGGVVADIDILDNDYKFDALIGQLLAYLLLGISLLIDYYGGFDLMTTVLSRNSIILKAGLIGYFILLLIGFLAEHRTFTHSILALLLYSFAVYLIYPSITMAYVIGYITHLVLDILNKKPVPLLFPKEGGVCLGLCYASKTANTFFMWLGIVGSVILIFNFLVFHWFL